tara:strand:- start:108 stop:299 length:192 start_codon:yes stop_codon:yes gene_type:complete
MYTLFICESFYTETQSFQSIDAAKAEYEKLKEENKIRAEIDVVYIHSIDLEKPIVLLQTNQGA